jgi:hypothetical protein
VATLINAAGQVGDNDTAEAWGGRAAALVAPPAAIDAQVVCICQASMLAFAALAAAGAGDLDEARTMVGRVKERLAPAPYRRIDDEHGTFVDYALAAAFAAVGEADLARAILRPSLAAIRAAVDDLADAQERARLLACPWPWRPTLELAETLGLAL